MYFIAGNTYPHRETLKALGCRWNPAEKAWETENPAAYKQGLELIGAFNRGICPPLPFIENPVDEAGYRVVNGRRYGGIF